jgi:hypothetical protein
VAQPYAIRILADLFMIAFSAACSWSALRHPPDQRPGRGALAAIRPHNIVNAASAWP